MGMGKTLSILALVIKTIEESHVWAEERMNEEVSHSEIKHYAHSTLIIVPSACKEQIDSSAGHLNYELTRR